MEEARGVTLAVEQAPSPSMNCTELAAKIQRFYPEAETLEVARMCALICSTLSDPDTLRDDRHFLDIWDQTNLRLQAVADQHAAITEELTELAELDPCDFSAEHIWVLIRSIKVQNQLLRLYVGQDDLAPEPPPL